MEPPLTREVIKEIHDVNVTRCNEWHAVSDWSPPQWANAMFGEAGELANVLKKILRHDLGIQQTATRAANLRSTDEEFRQALVEHVAGEIGDTYAYMDLLMEALAPGLMINPWMTIDRKFEPKQHVSDWGCELGRRIGLLCGTAQLDVDTMEEADLLASSAGSVLSVLHVIAVELQLELEDCIRTTFNKISEREGLPQRL